MIVLVILPIVNGLTPLQYVFLKTNKTSALTLLVMTHAKRDAYMMVMLSLSVLTKNYLIHKVGQY